MARLISVAKMADKDILSAWVEDDESYIHYTVSRAGGEIVEKMEKADYKDYEHFVGIMGKFRPFTFFLTNPMTIQNRTWTYEAVNTAYNFLVSEGIIER